jgi:hypothetical protein
MIIWVKSSRSNSQGNCVELAVIESKEIDGREA